CVGPGDQYAGKWDWKYYGQDIPDVDPSPVPKGPGIFTITPHQTIENSARTRITDITDGSANTVMLSEGLTGTRPSNQGYLAPGEILQRSMGGSLFSNFTTPNSTVPDRLAWLNCGNWGCPTGNTNSFAPAGCGHNVVDPHYPASLCVDVIDYPSGDYAA